MDLATLGGVLLAVLSIVVGYSIEGGNIGHVFLLAPMMVVLGGTLGAATITSSLPTIMNMPRLLKLAMFGKESHPHEIIESIVAIAEKARREGLLALESEAKNVKNAYLRQGIELVVDGTDPALVREVLETQIRYMEERHKKGIAFFNQLGGFSPTLGVLGTVLSMVHVLSNTEDAASMAESIASAFIATLWGVGTANVFYLPIAQKLKLRHEEEVEVMELITEGVLAIHSGENPRVIRTKLMSFLPPSKRTAAAA